MSENIIEIRKLSKSYKQGEEKLQILKECDFSAKQGEIIGIVGQSGSGKSTLLHILGLLDDFDDGELVFNKQNVKNLTDAEKSEIRLNRIGFIYQFHHLLPEFTVGENITLPTIVAAKCTEYSKLKLKTISKNLGIDHKLASYPSEISGGEQQRTAIARAIINHPLLILADEPTGNLDPKNSEIVMNSFINLVRETNLTAIIVTHNFQLIDSFDKIYHLVEGKLEKYDSAK